jgi:sRNA-binding regulator protein Hfq
MANVVKTEWFGKQISVLMINGKSVTGELTEVTDNYIVLTVGSAQTQVMVHAIIAVRPASERDSGGQS